MASVSPSPNSPPSVVPPPSSSSAPPPSTNGTSGPPSSGTPSTPPPQSPPSTVPSAPPPAVPSAPPPVVTLPPPPTTPTLPPPPPVAPVSPPVLTPPVSSPPPATSPPPPVLSPPPPPTNNSPPPVSPSPPSPPPPQAIPPSSPPPIVSPPPPNLPPPSANSPPPPENSAPPPTLTPPPPSDTQPASPPSPPKSPSPPPPRNQPQPIPPSLSPPSPPSPPFPSGPPKNDTSSIVPGPPGRSGSKTGSTVAIAVVASVVVLSLIAIAVWFVRKQKKRPDRYNGVYVMPSPSASSYKSDSAFIRANPSPPLRSGSGSDFVHSPPDPGGLSNSKAFFTYEELLKVTDGFSERNLLGEGGFGCVYKGILPDRREVAVKQLKIGGSQGEREFKAEVETISRVHHRHLVSLVGYCISEHERLLVYDFVPNNTLHYHLHGDKDTVMDWATRLKVAIGAARGIAYLHEYCHPRIIHRDIKSSNILLDNNFEALVSDFGLAKLALDANTHVTTRVMGTFGYLAPEYASSGKLTEKSDVYSFGVVLLEIITGRKPVDTSQPIGDESLVEWARPLLNRAIDTREFEVLVDPKLGNNYVPTEMLRMVEGAAACVRHLASKRPRMGQLVRTLECIDDSGDINNGMRPGQSELFNSAEQSAEIRLFQKMAFGGAQDFSTGFFGSSSSSTQN